MPGRYIPSVTTTNAKLLKALKLQRDYLTRMVRARKCFVQKLMLVEEPRISLKINLNTELT